MRKSIVALIALFAAVVLVLWSTKGSERASSRAPVQVETEPRPEARSLDRVELVPGPEPDEEPPIAAESSGRTPIERPAASSSAPPLATTLHVRVIAEGSGKALAGVNTYVWKDEPPREADALADEEQDPFTDLEEPNELGLVSATDSEGKATLRVPSEMPLVLHGEGEDAEVGNADVKVPPLAMGEQREILVHLSVGGVHYCGRVVDRETRAPLEGAVAMVRSQSDRKILTMTASDASGAFALDVSRRGGFEVCIEAEGFGLAYAEIDKQHPSPKRAQVFALAKAASITGRVLDPDGSAKAGVEVRATTTRDALRQPIPSSFGVADDADPEWTTKTDESGRYRLAGLPARVSLQLGLKDEETPRIEHLALAPGEEREVDIVVIHDVTLSGLVLDQNERPIVDREIEILHEESGAPVIYFAERWMRARSSFFVTTDSTGRFRQALRPGRWFVGRAAGTDAMMGRLPDEKLPEEDRIATYGQLVEVQREPSEQEVVVHVSRGLYIRGRVVDADGNAVERTLLRCKQASCEGPFNVKTAPDGTFAIGPLIEGEYQVAVQWPRGQVPVSARAGDTDVVVHLQRPPTGSIHVRIAANGRAVPRAEVTLTWSGGSQFPGPPVNGEYVFDHLEPGTYDAIAKTESLLGFAGGVSPSSDGTVVLIELRPSTTLRVTYVGDEPDLSLIARQGSTPVAYGMARAGTSSVLQVPPGPLSIELAPWRPFASAGAPAGASAGAPAADLPRWTREVSAVLGQEIEVELP